MPRTLPARMLHRNMARSVADQFPVPLTAGSLPAALAPPPTHNKQRARHGIGVDRSNAKVLRRPLHYFGTKHIRVIDAVSVAWTGPALAGRYRAIRFRECAADYTTVNGQELSRKRQSEPRLCAILLIHFLRGVDEPPTGCHPRPRFCLPQRRFGRPLAWSCQGRQRLARRQVDQFHRSSGGRSKKGSFNCRQGNNVRNVMHLDCTGSEGPF